LNFGKCELVKFGENANDDAENPVAVNHRIDYTENDRLVRRRQPPLKIIVEFLPRTH
jgi:hypothetical protein